MIKIYLDMVFGEKIVSEILCVIFLVANLNLFAYICGNIETSNLYITLRVCKVEMK